ALGIDLNFFVAGGERDEALQVVLGLARILAGGCRLGMDGEDVVDGLAEVFELGELELDTWFLEDAVDEFFGVHGFSVAGAVCYARRRAVVIADFFSNHRRTTMQTVILDAKRIRADADALRTGVSTGWSRLSSGRERPGARVR